MPVINEQEFIVPFLANNSDSVVVDMIEVQTVTTITEHISIFLNDSFDVAHSLTNSLMAHGLALVALMIVCMVTHWITCKILTQLVARLVEKTKNQWDDVIIDNHVFDRLAHIVPALVLYLGTEMVFAREGVTDFIEKTAMAYMILMVARAVDGFLSAIVDIYRHFDRAKNRPIKSYVQVAKIFLYIIAGILLISAMLGKDPSGVLVGLGGMSAVLLLVFKDSIMGLVASVQLVNNDMIRRGDWVTIPQYKADGDVLDISLNTIKIQNFDKTITTVPTYSLISSSFQNWRGMEESDGRRIKRAIHIDMNTISFCDETMIEQFREFSLIHDYIGGKLNDINGSNEGRDMTHVTNGRRLTNVGTYRAYIQAYLKAHPMINKNLTFLVRQLAPSETGLPIELYVFSNDKNWINYEGIQADIFDHLLAVLPEFGLKPFQHASGNDFQRVFQS